VNPGVTGKLIVGAGLLDELLLPTAAAVQSKRLPCCVGAPNEPLIGLPILKDPVAC
jgi:hypothetical protein